jgi:mannose-6-phosphate isomerase-like protein (cupin superfamily)
LEREKMERNGPQSRANVRPYVLQAGEGVAGLGGAVKASRISTGGNLTVIESRTRGGAPLHVHTREDEYFYVVEGTLSIRCDEERFEAGPRSFVFLPRGIPHAWDVSSQDGATLLILTVPAMLEEFLQEYHAAVGAERDQVAAKYGITFLVE